MRKKKQMEIYKCGMEAGAAPFEKKYEETAKQHEHGELFHTLQQLKAGDQLLIIVGCEGGFDESEIQELNEMGVKCCSLGNRILRSETAPLYLMSVIGYSRELIK